MTWLLDGWAERILSATLQGTIAIVAALVLTRTFSRMPALLKVWFLRIALLKMHVGALFVGGFALLTARGISPAPPRAESVFTPVVGYLLPLACAMWLVSLVVGVLRHVRAHRQIAALLETSSPLGDARANAAVSALADRLNLRQLPELRVSAAVTSPLLVRHRKTCIILPAALVDFQDSKNVDAAIAHELAHQKHRDLGWAWLTLLSDVLFFFNPLTACGLKDLRLHEECAADEAAMRAVGSSPSAYSRTLLSFATHGLQVTGAFAMADSAVELQKRIESLYSSKKGFPAKQRVFAIAASAVCVGSLVPWTIASTRAFPKEPISPIAAPAFSPMAAPLAARERT